VDNSGNRAGGGFGCGDHVWVYPVREAVHYVGGNLVPDVAATADTTGT
jgi:hypothetical protein